MKKNFIFCLVLFFLISTTLVSFSKESEFSKAIKTCQNYTKNQDIIRGGEFFNIKVSLENKGNACVYKEKISQGDEFFVLTCNFSKNVLNYLSGQMEIYNDTYKNQIAKENIFEAKMTNNPAILDKYLSNPQYCNITTSKSK